MVLQRLGPLFQARFTVAEAGLNGSINWNKEFIDKSVALARKQPAKRLVTSTLELKGIDVSNDEAILHEGAAVGYISSGGFAHHVGRSMAMGYVPAELSAGGQKLEVEILGQMYSAEVQSAPLYDPDGLKMRS